MPATPKRLRRQWLLTVVLLFGISIPMLGGYLWYQHAIEAPLTILHNTTFIINPGERANLIVERLADEGLIHSALAAKIHVWRHDLGSRFRSGRFEIDPQMTTFTLLALLCNTSSAERPAGRIRFLEGWRLDDMANQWSRTTGLSPESFMQALDAARPSLLEPDSPRWLSLRESLGPRAVEGLVFPDTYALAATNDPGQLIERAQRRFEQIFEELVSQAGEPLDTLMHKHDLEFYDLVIIASIVEREGMVDDELPVIARVIYNRLERGMRLQMDPTCAYPLEYRERPLVEACHDPQNPYSTYVIDGLPASPICSPGRSAIQAAMNPDPGTESSNLLFFVARQDGSGRHVFAQTYEEHRRNVDRYLRTRRE